MERDCGTSSHLGKRGASGSWEKDVAKREGLRKRQQKKRVVSTAIRGDSPYLLKNGGGVSTEKRKQQGISAVRRKGPVSNAMYGEEKKQHSASLLKKSNSSKA